MKRLAVILAAFLICGTVLAQRPAGHRLYYSTSCDISALSPSADASKSGSWVVTEGTDLYDEVDEAAEAGGKQAPDDDTSTIAQDLSSGGGATVTWDLENDTAYAAANRQIRWVSVAAYLKIDTDNGLSDYTGVSEFDYVISAADYTVGFDVTGTSAIWQPAEDTYFYYDPGPDSSWTTNANSDAPRQYTNPATGVAWTSSDIDALQLKLTSTDSGSNATTITWSDVKVIVCHDGDDTALNTGELQSGAN